ncbi:uncharacterized protein SPSK_10392 [Sporothrix schenckii 1099-18]|uniref:CYTH domain-containing protein n=2 Tax=Sporothrix schenckii TaxID=29908 RepID=U7PJL6_SPOS1|nr:uncharacterized protein SPSK_10392 [Sporothrix schenckii 1099-18]ERS95116.1 hypothetical protein HMPREF1624_08608 [Sporothrix schenckii ATCC 58251]KJR87264.1 hypothetical protein SPSK_10392 [Sporothrix schenckii 1099-18]
MLSTKSLLTAVLALPAAILAADGPMVPDYEIHLQLDPTVVLDSNFRLVSAVIDEFAMPTTVTKKNVQYIDTLDKALDAQGWSCRIRNVENKSGFDLTYKWRLPIQNSDITGALNTAFADGWNSGQGNYAAQVDWYLDSQELSVSRDYTASSSGYSGTTDPSEADSRSLLIANAPKMFDNWVTNGWGTDELAGGAIYGPVLTKASAGTWDGRELDIEIWPIENSAGTGIAYLVEASFKTDDYDTAVSGQAGLIALLKSKGWFLDASNSKEALVLANYHPTS